MFRCVGASALNGGCRLGMAIDDAAQHRMLLSGNYFTTQLAYSYALEALITNTIAAAAAALNAG